MKTIRCTVVIEIGKTKSLHIAKAVCNDKVFKINGCDFNGYPDVILAFDTPNVKQISHLDTVMCSQMNETYVDVVEIISHESKNRMVYSDMFSGETKELKHEI